jgi:predicted nucleic acid-binding protein
VVRTGEKVRAASDPDDNKFLECAEAAKADFLGTGKLRHFPKERKGTRILNARQVIEELD